MQTGVVTGPRGFRETVHHTHRRTQFLQKAKKRFRTATMNLIRKVVSTQSQSKFYKPDHHSHWQAGAHSILTDPLLPSDPSSLICSHKPSEAGCPLISPQTIEPKWRTLQSNVAAQKLPDHHCKKMLCQLLVLSLMSLRTEPAAKCLQQDLRWAPITSVGIPHPFHSVEFKISLPFSLTSIVHMYSSRWVMTSVPQLTNKFKLTSISKKTKHSILPKGTNTHPHHSWLCQPHPSSASSLHALANGTYVRLPQPKFTAFQTGRHKWLSAPSTFETLPLLQCCVCEHLTVRGTLHSAQTKMQHIQPQRNKRNCGVTFFTPVSISAPFQRLGKSNSQRIPKPKNI